VHYHPATQAPAIVRTRNDDIDAGKDAACTLDGHLAQCVQCGLPLLQLLLHRLHTGFSRRQLALPILRRSPPLEHRRGMGTATALHGLHRQQHETATHTHTAVTNSDHRVRRSRSDSRLPRRSAGSLAAPQRRAQPVAYCALTPTRQPPRPHAATPPCDGRSTSLPLHLAGAADPVNQGQHARHGLTRPSQTHTHASRYSSDLAQLRHRRLALSQLLRESLHLRLPCGH
jgi:hypothetical protein